MKSENENLPVRLFEFGLYETALLSFRNKIEKFNSDFYQKNNYHLIETIKCRIKTDESVRAKLAAKKVNINYESAVKNIKDIAGIRIICPFVDDVYFVLAYISNIPDLTILQIKDYIEKPKDNGYRSLHLHVEVPLVFNEYQEHVVIEIQLRTIAMDFWASLEHQLVYKNTFIYGKGKVNRELLEYSQMLNTIDKRMQVLKRSDYCGEDTSSRR